MFPAMPPDIEKYRRYVDGFDLSEERKVELIHTVWAIMESFVDRAFGLHPVQLCRSASPAGDSNAAADQIDSEVHSLDGEFRDAAGDSAGEKDVEP